MIVSLQHWHFDRNFWFKAEQRAALKNFLGLKDVFASPWHKFSETLQLIVAHYVATRHFLLSPLSPTWCCDLKKWKKERKKREKLIAAVFFESLGQNVSAVSLKVLAPQTALSYTDSCNKWLADVASSLLSINTWLRLAAKRPPNPPSPTCHKCSPKSKSAQDKNTPNMFVVALFQSQFPSSDLIFLTWKDPQAWAPHPSPWLCFFGFSAAVWFSCSVMIRSFTRHYVTCFSASIAGLISRLYE